MSDDREVYVVVAEWAGQAPIVMETEGVMSSLRAAQDRAGSKRFVRYCIARLTYVTGNELMIRDLARLQSEFPKDREPEF